MSTVNRKREAACLYRSTPRAKELKRKREKRYRDRNRERLEKNSGKDRERHRKWREKNKDKIREYNRKWREAHMELAREITREWRSRHPERVKTYRAKFKATHPEYNKIRYAIRRLDPSFLAYEYARHAEYRETHREHLRDYDRRRRKSPKYRQVAARRNKAKRLLFATDVAAYQRELQRKRDYTRRKSEAEGRVYRPVLSKRKPSWSVYGIDSHLMASSPYVRNNHDSIRLREFDGYARELAISRREQIGL